ncbi:MAG: hypothetical protein AUI53_01665 [Acidobacteria bacterium 13_1_40CM_2_60_7]|nr:MAG: hypothetical protein AUI53_01665 [Acidobacteria bacterium 13_1_40CM_2_60_7]PYU04431.1 MAG: hypothetical protein DMG33_14205 [Acidobacteriota bacterium]
MSETTITLQDLFSWDPEALSLRAEPGVDVNEAAQQIKQAIQKNSRVIQWGWIRDLIAKKLPELLDMNVLDVVLDAWKKYMQLEQYTDRQKYRADETILVPLAEHTLKSEHHPYVEILLKEQPVGRIVFDLEFSLTLDGFVLKIQDGMIQEIQAGSAKGDGSLSLGEAVILKRELAPVHFPGHIHFDKGVALPGRRGLAAAG